VTFVLEPIMSVQRCAQAEFEECAAKHTSRTACYILNLEMQTWSTII